jgi:DNA-binding response OmpR family regulator
VIFFTLCILDLYRLVGFLLRLFFSRQGSRTLGMLSFEFPSNLPKMRIAILENDWREQALLIRSLAQPLDDQEKKTGDTSNCHVVDNGEALKTLLRQESFDLLILGGELGAPVCLDLLRWVRTWRQDAVPVLVLSSISSEQVVAEAFHMGADDYLVRPYQPLELRARAARLLRQSQGAAWHNKQTFGPWMLDTATARVSYQATPDDAPKQHALTGREFRLARLLFSRLGQTTSRAHLIEALGYAPQDTCDNTLNRHIHNLRRKLRLDGSRGIQLVAMYGTGYCLDFCRDAGAQESMR